MVLTRFKDERVHLRDEIVHLIEPVSSLASIHYNDNTANMNILPNMQNTDTSRHNISYEEKTIHGIYGCYRIRNILRKWSKTFKRN